MRRRKLEEARPQSCKRCRTGGILKEFKMETEAFAAPRGTWRMSRPASVCCGHQLARIRSGSSGMQAAHVHGKRNKEHDGCGKPLSRCSAFADVGLALHPWFHSCRPLPIRLATTTRHSNRLQLSNGRRLARNARRRRSKAQRRLPGPGAGLIGTKNWF